MFNSIRVYARNVAVAAGVALLATVALPQLKASPTDKSVTMTFSAAVEIPGKVLPAGTYVFRTAPGNPNIIMIMNADETKSFGMTLRMPTYSADVPEKVHVDFEERLADTPQALKSWTYPGDPYGFAFVYPERTTGLK